MCVRAEDFPGNSEASFSDRSCNRRAGLLSVETGYRLRISCRTSTRALVQKRRMRRLPEQPAPVYQRGKESALPTLISKDDRSAILQRRSSLCQWPSPEASYALQISEIFRLTRLHLSDTVSEIDSRLES